MIPQNALFHRAKTFDSGLRTGITKIGFELNTNHIQCVKRVAQQQIFTLGVDPRPPDGRSQPGVADLTPPVCGGYVKQAGATNEVSRFLVKDGEGQGDGSIAGSGVIGQGRVEVTLQTFPRGEGLQGQIRPDFGVLSGFKQGWVMRPVKRDELGTVAGEGDGIKVHG